MRVKRESYNEVIEPVKKFLRAATAWVVRYSLCTLHF